MLLQKNPLTMVGTIDQCWLFTYQTPIAEVENLMPPQLSLVTHKGYAFWNVVVSHIQDMRPKYFPAFTGVSYWHIAYRLYVRFQPAEGEPIEGLYFLRSDCNSKLMTRAGNIMTDFNFHPSDVRLNQSDKNRIAIEIGSPDAPARAKLEPNLPAELPSYSAFSSLAEAAAFLKYKPFGISVNKKGEVNVVQISRKEEEWISKLVKVEAADWAYFTGKKVKPEICYQVAPIFYQWNRARVYRQTVFAARDYEKSRGHSTIG